MSKKRMVHDCIWRSEDVAMLTMRQRLLWIGLITTADDQGRGKAHPGLVRAAVFPFDIISQEEIQDDLDAIEAAGMVLLYEAENTSYYQITNWWEYQSPQWVGPSDFPAPDGWEDRMRYHGKGHKVITINWPGTDDQLPNDKAGKSADKSALAIEEGKEEGKEKEDTTSKSDELYTEILEAWEELFPNKVQPRPTTRSNIRKVETRMKDAEFREQWRDALERAATSSFLRDGGWFQLDWFLKNDENWQKCLQGRYDDNGKNDDGVVGY